MTRAEYVTALNRHDWDYDYSSDQHVWHRGRNEWLALIAAQNEIDPDFSIWNRYAPPSHWRTS